MLVFRKSGLRALIIVALCAVLGFASGCSALRIGYGTAPDLVYWWLDNYADLDSAQAPRVRAALAQWFDWHRRTQLPDYAAQLAKAQAEVRADTSAARACEWQAELTTRATTAFDRAVPAAAELVLTLTPQQIQHVERRYAKINDEYRDDFLQGDLRKRARAALERTVDRVELLYGRLDDAQRKRVAETLQHSPFDPEIWFAERRQRQQDALQLLRKLNADGATRERAEALLRSYAQGMQRSPREAYQRYADRLVEFNCAFAASLHNSTSPAQRGTAAQRLAGWEGDLRAIVANGAAAAARTEP